MTPARHYRVRLAKGSPFSALKVWWGFAIDPDTLQIMVERPAMWRAVLNGEHVPIEDVSFLNDDTAAEPVVKGEAVDEIEYERILKTHILAKTHAPHWPEAQPRKAIDHLAGDLIF